MKPDRITGRFYNITQEERLLLRSALQNISDGYFVIGIDLVGMSMDTVHMGFYIAPEYVVRAS